MRIGKGSCHIVLSGGLRVGDLGWDVISVSTVHFVLSSNRDYAVVGRYHEPQDQ